MSILSSGESYAGIYVPTLVYQIMKMNEIQSKDRKLNLKGFAVCLTRKLLFHFCFKVGNGCIGNSVGACSVQGMKIHIDFYHGHGLFSNVSGKSVTKY